MDLPRRDIGTQLVDLRSKDLTSLLSAHQQCTFPFSVSYTTSLFVLKLTPPNKGTIICKRRRTLLKALDVPNVNVRQGQSGQASCDVAFILMLYM